MRRRLCQKRDVTLQQVVKILLAEKADVNACNKDLNTPLLVACAEGHTAVAYLRPAGSGVLTA